MTPILIQRARIDLLDVHSTIEPLRGGARQSNAPFNFLFTKAAYNWWQGRTEDALVAPDGTHAVPLRVGSVSGGSSGVKNFWRGAGASPRVRAYTGYLGGRSMAEVAWDLFVPFALDLPVTVGPAPGTPARGGAPATVSVFLWPSGWAVRLTLEVHSAGRLDQFAARMLTLPSEKLTAAIGAERTVGTPADVLAWIADWVRQRLIQPIFVAALPAAMRFGPFTFVTVYRGSGSVASPSALDESSQRHIYAAATQNHLWNSFALAKISAAFKPLDSYPGSFIFMDRMARLVWFPSLMGKKPHKALDCYVENTLAATLMMAAMAEFLRLVTAQLDSTAVKLNPTIRNLYRSAATQLTGFATVYQNTNLKRLAADLDVPGRVKDALARLV